jgi:hypothetical protein
MADLKISQLSVDTALTGPEKVPIVDNTNKVTTAAAIAALAAATNLAYDPTTRLLTSSTGTDVTLPLAGATDPGLLTAAEKQLIASALQAGQAFPSIVDVRNASGSTLTIGTPVYVPSPGSSGTRPLVVAADASLEPTAARTLGLMWATAGNNSDGKIITHGILSGVNTSALTEGAAVWLSETTGQLTSTRPTQPAHGVFMGFCIKQGAGASGILYVNVINGQELEELHDVLITGLPPAVGAPRPALVRASDGLWKDSLLTPADVGAAASGAPAAAVSAHEAAADPHPQYLTAAEGDAAYAGKGTFTGSTAGLVPPSGGGTTNFLRADGTFAAPPGGTGSPGGTTTQAQYNLAGAFAGAAGLTFDGDGNVNLGVFTGRLRLPLAVSGSPQVGDVYLSSGTPFFRDASNVEQRLLMASGNLGSVADPYTSFVNLFFGGTKVPIIANGALGIANGTGATADLGAGTSSGTTPNHSILSTGSTASGAAVHSVFASGSGNWSTDRNRPTLQSFSVFNGSFFIRIPTLSDGAEGFRVYVGGYADNATFANRRSVGLMINGNTAYACATTGGVETLSSGTVTVAASTWVKVNIGYDGTNLRVTIDNGTALTINSGYPTATMHWGAFIIKTLGTTSRALHVATLPTMTFLTA